MTAQSRPADPSNEAQTPSLPPSDPIPPSGLPGDPTTAPAPSAEPVVAPADAAATGPTPAPAERVAATVAAPDAARAMPRDPAPATVGTAPVATDGSRPTGEPLIRMRGVSRRFEDREVVRGIDLDVPRGTILGVIGPSGSGKTTTIRMLTGAIAPTAGEISVLGRAPKRFSRRDRERLGYMPQTFSLYGDLTTRENVDFVASLFGLIWPRRGRRVREALQTVDLWDARGRRASRLSGGMQRRLELACALVHDPELIILDEPTAGIDPLLRGSIWEELHRLRDAGRTLLVTTQQVSEAEECDAVAMIVGGRIIALAPPDELRRMATHGDLLDIETSAVYEATDLVGTEGVREVTQDGPRHFRVVVDDAGAALPIVVEKIRSSGVDVESAREHRLSFDEIFAILVARHEDELRAADEAASGPDDPAAPGSGSAGREAAA